MAVTSIKRLTKPPEQAYLEREATTAKRAMRKSLGALRQAADPVVLIRCHPIAAGLLIGGAAAVAVAVIARGRRNDGTEANCSVEPGSEPKHGVLRDVGRAVRGGLLSLLVTKLLAKPSRASADDPDLTVD